MSDDPTAALPSRDFQPRRFGLGAWTGHLHFACDLMATVRPKLFVELGTDRGESYFAFCQAAAEAKTGTRCVAIDTWAGDHQTGVYDETTLEQVRVHNDRHYRAFSTLVRSRFSEAARDFPDESIDLLHLDGLHTEAAVREDLATWLPKLRGGGLLLMHDISVRTRDFGVWKVWEEIRRQGRAFAFEAQPGLGLWQKPPAGKLPEPLESLLHGDQEVAAKLSDYYEERTREIQARIAGQWADGSIRESAIGDQTAVQIFPSHDGLHREEDSVTTRVGHDQWKELQLELPEGARAAPLRLDFYSPLTLIDISALTVRAGEAVLFSATHPPEFSRIEVRGDGERRDHPAWFRLAVTGPDPQLYLPVFVPPAGARLRVDLRLRVNPGAPPD